MKRIGNIYHKIFEYANLELADTIAQKGKMKQPVVVSHNKKREQNLTELQKMLMDGTFKTSPYTVFKIYEPKEREVFRLPYFPDRILHHAIMNVLESVFVSHFTADTYSCIKGRGIHSAASKLKKALKNQFETAYCLKLDINKFYPSIDHSILKALLRTKFKDPQLLTLLDGIIDSADGLPIGNYLSQYFANFYLSGFDHWIKEEKRVKYYFRYCDDMVFLARTKEELHVLLADIREYLQTKLNLKIKSNYQVFPVASRGIDFLGYKFYHTHTLLRKSIKKNFARAISKNANKQSIAAYTGWAKHANTNNLIKKLIPDEKV